MIRRDYLVRMVQELTQAFARILFLKKSQEYARAAQEIENVLTRFWNLTPEQLKALSVERWIELTQHEEGSMGEKLVALADLLREQAELYRLEGNEPEGQRSAPLSLGLYVEAALTPGAIISVELLDKIGGLVETTKGSRLPPEVLKRLVSYYETRGQLAKAEDTLFDWLDAGDPHAPVEGLAFYNRLTAMSDGELEQGGLPREEIEQGMREVAGRRQASPLSRA